MGSSSGDQSVARGHGTLWDQSAVGPKHAVVVEDPLQSCPKWVTVSGGPLLCHARCFLTRIERPEQRVDITAEH